MQSSLKLTFSSLKIGRLPKKEIHLPSLSSFRGKLAVSFREGRVFAWEIHYESQLVSRISETSAVFQDFSTEKKPLTFHPRLFNKDPYDGLLIIPT